MFTAPAARSCPTPGDGGAPTGLMITLAVLSLGLIGYSLEQRMAGSQ
jgi:hypothetical protein